MAKSFRLPCALSAYLNNPDKTKRPPLPGWLARPPADTYAARVSHAYWSKLYWATPPWVDAAMMERMREIYLAAPEGFHVDHIVPMKSPLVCGLNVPWNLEIREAKANMRKSNRHWPGHPFDEGESPQLEMFVDAETGQQILF